MCRRVKRRKSNRFVGLFATTYSNAFDNGVKDAELLGGYAKSIGKYKGRKKIESPEFDKIYQLWASKQISAVKAMEQLDMKPNTFYRRVRERQY